MHVVANSNLISFCQNPSYRDAEPALTAWHEEAKKAKWTTPADIKARYASVVFHAIWNIKPRLSVQNCVANPRNSRAIAVVCALF